MRKSAGSYTIEASFVMSAVLFAMVFLVKSAYRQCRQTSGAMRMHGMVEAARYLEDGGIMPTIDSLSYRILIEKDGMGIRGQLNGDGWDLSIKSHIFAPEE
ncbi:MAG: hypothetical protein RR995_05100, partial [Hungatella sp.]